MLVAQAQPGFYPAVIDAAIGGTSTATAAGVIDDTMSTFPGRYVVLAYGTNDDPANFRMEDLVLKVFAAGKVPVIPHMPWSDTTNVQQRGPGFNAAIQPVFVILTPFASARYRGSQLEKNMSTKAQVNC